MISNLCGENLSSRLYQEYSAKVHKRKLERIQRRPNFSLVPSSDSFQKDHKKSISFLEGSKFNNISRENKLLYEKLTVISERKSRKQLYTYSTPRTLNFVARKKQTEKIIKENHDLIHRLIELPSHFSVKKFREEYDMAQRYKENMSKKRILDRIQKLVKSHAMPVLSEASPKNESSANIKTLKTIESQD